MIKHGAFRLLIASDGSPASRAAVTTALAFPWPAETQAHALIAQRTWATAGRSAYAYGVLNRTLERVRADLGRTFGRRWPSGRVKIVDRPPVDAIVAESERLRAGAVVLGWRGFGTFRRLLLGSVSRGVVRRARCPVLVVRRRRRRVRSLVIGLDGSPNARRAAAFVARLPAPRGGRATLVRVIDPLVVPSAASLPPGVRVRLSREAAALHAEEAARAKRELEEVAARLRRAGWRVRTTVPSGAPLHEVLATVEKARADLLVLGAHGTTGLKGILLGSLAEGALNRCDVPVLLVR